MSSGGWIVPIIQQKVLAFPWPSGIRSLLVHPAGPFTSKSIHNETALRTLFYVLICLVFFWAPAFKWMITISNIKDMEKPAEQISAN